MRIVLDVEGKPGFSDAAVADDLNRIVSELPERLRSMAGDPRITVAPSVQENGRMKITIDAEIDWDYLLGWINCALAGVQRGAVVVTTRSNLR